MRWPSIALALSFLLLATPAYAQYGLHGLGQGITIGMVPAHPGVHETVQLTVRSSIFDISHSVIVWSANGKVIAKGTGADTASIPTGDLGSQTTVTVQLTAPDESSAEASARVIPTQVDLLVDSDSYTPPFYRGKALASAGSNLILQALPHFARPGGSQIPASDLIYTWKRNGQVLGDISGLGKSAVVIPAPVLYGRDVVSVEIASSDGVLAGESSLAIKSLDPMLVLYEDHPLFGILFGSALGASTFIPESEMTFIAVPYFSSVRTPLDSALQYAWRVNGTRLTTDPKKPNEFTLQSGESNTVALIQVELTHAINYFLDAKGSWSVTFSAKGGTQDFFHTGAQ